MGLIFWLAVAPAIAAVLLLVIPQAQGNVAKAIALLGTVVSLVLALAGWGMFHTHQSGFQLVSRLNWFTLPNAGVNDLRIGLHFGIDGLSLPLITLAAVIALATIIASDASKMAMKAYYVWMLLAISGVLVVFSSLDIFSFFVGLEMTLFSTFFLLYHYGGKGREKAAFKFLIYRGLATVFLLTALIGFAYGKTGLFGGYTSPTAHNVLTLSIPALTHSPWVIPTSVASALFILLLIGVLIEEAFVPFHSWLPTAHESADMPTSMLLGGILTKTGAYALLRFGVGFMPVQVSHYSTLIAVLGAINILYGAFAAWAQKDWRRLIAFGSISHMGLVLLGISALDAAGLQGAMFMMVSSGLLTALLFFLTGSMKQRTKTLWMPSLGGLSKSMPMLSGFLLLAALASLGLPLTSGFISEIQAFIGGFAVHPYISFVAVLGVVLSAVYLLYAMEKTTFGPTPNPYANLSDATAIEYVPIVMLVLLVLLVGVYPNMVGSVFGQSVHALLRIGG